MQTGLGDGHAAAPWLVLREGPWEVAAGVGAPAGTRARDWWPSRPAAGFSAGEDAPADWGFFK